MTRVLRRRGRCHAVRVPFRYHMHHIVNSVFRGVLGEVLGVRWTVYLAAVAAARPASDRDVTLRFFPLFFPRLQKQRTRMYNGEEYANELHARQRRDRTRSEHLGRESVRF